MTKKNPNPANQKEINSRLFEQAKKIIPGGVNSPVRSFKAVGGSPLYIHHAKGSTLFTTDGRELIDYCLSWGALILGHACPAVVEKLKKTSEKGFSFGAPTEQETELAETISKAIPSMEKVRLANSGTEAVMTAIRISRAYTKRNKIIKFIGSYHGHADYLLNCPGIPEDFSKHTLLAPYNDIEKVKDLIRRHKNEIAAIIIEPVAGNVGVILPLKGFLKNLREVTKKNGIVLIFDEVITGFRLTYGGMQNIARIKPDLTTLGKIVGGGCPVGAVGGRNEMMQLLAPAGEVYQAGTFSGNPLTVNAGLTTLQTLCRTNPYPKLQDQTKKITEGILKISKKYRINLRINSIGSMFSLFFTDRDVINYDPEKSQNVPLFKAFYHAMLKEGIYFSPSGFESNFVSVSHTDKEINQTLNAADKVLFNLRNF